MPRYTNKWTNNYWFQLLSLRQYNCFKCSVLEVNFSSNMSASEVSLLLDPLLIHLKKNTRREHHRSWQLLINMMCLLTLLLHFCYCMCMSSTIPSHPNPFEIQQISDFEMDFESFSEEVFHPGWYQAKWFVELIKTRRMPHSLFIAVYLFLFSNHYTCRSMQ